MFHNLHSFVKQHQAFYEVSPYYVLLQERHGSGPPTTQRVQAGFDVEIFGVNTKNEMVAPGSDPVYGLGLAELQKVAERVSYDARGSCHLEVVSFPSMFLVDSRNEAKVEGMFRIRISHYRGLEEPARSAEEEALAKLENELERLGIVRRLAKPFEME